VEAAGIEPAQSENPNPLMARDFYSKRFQGLHFTIPPLSPAVLPNPLLSSPVVEVFWRRQGKFPAPEGGIALVLSPEHPLQKIHIPRLDGSRVNP